jgi:hypothetical protein
MQGEEYGDSVCSCILRFAVQLWCGWMVLALSRHGSIFLDRCLVEAGHVPDAQSKG